ncbi:ParB/RepB/Spo0J family partition protein [Polaromonas aquatica]|uniref:ParB/RepB/Spo0J family partition protein n=1 Tax=Polaromonas aquatica TaxID=332657 RepID=A0ABW1TWL7_9BURK
MATKPKPFLIRRNTDHEAMQKALSQSNGSSDASLTPISVPLVPSVHGTEIDISALQIGQVYDVPLTKLQRSEVNARVFYSNEELDDMSKSLKEKGQDIPAIGYPKNGRITVIDGQKRFQASTNASLPTLQVLIVVPPVSDSEEYEESRRINLHRSSQTALDDAVRWKGMIDKGTYANQAELAAKLEVSIATVSKTISITDIPERLLRMMSDHTQTRTLSIAYEVSRLFNAEKFKDKAEEVEHLAQDVIDEIKKKDMGRNQVKSLIDSKLEGPKQRMRAEAVPVKYGEVKGSLKVFPSRGQLELSFSGLPEEKVTELKERIEQMLSGQLTM